ncbi:MAG: Cytosine deaminase [Candidatus Gottesmanbacteria bacterium GW2011_GWC2_39_8]|uniref:tRNA-specific adenosine deaminase n=1 Tax=Candidatus Gottesmanbacteria bacterium GW2011_GWC2_39_8 TaxID=1618450 RepID=A0A0G0SZ65_9BACT|nr:MAG: Cytosine deaminase [Candidatus Gottesmanbacteria bacterium GW2011_GWC2_39_8]
MDSFLHLKFMEIALEEAQAAYRENEVPVGAAVVYQNRIIAKDHNRMEQRQDPTAHAEMLVLKRAAEVLRSWRLQGTSLYVTIEPCPMCAGAMHLARIEKLIFGARDGKKGAAGSLYNIPSDERLNHRILIFDGVMGKECRTIIENFFLEKRNQ